MCYQSQVWCLSHRQRCFLASWENHYIHGFLRQKNVYCYVCFCVHYVLSRMLHLNISALRPRGLTSTRWGCYGLCLWHKPAELAHSFLFCSCIYFCLCDPLDCISFHKFSRQLFVFSLCSSGLVCALLVLSTIYVSMKVSFSPDVILTSWLGSKHQLTN